MMSTELLSNISDSDHSYFNNPIAMVICRCDADLTMISANNATYTLLGCTREQLAENIKNKAGLLIHPDDRSKIIGLAKKQLKAGNATFSVTLRVKYNFKRYVVTTFDGTFFTKEGETVPYVAFSSAVNATQIYSTSELHSMQDFIYKATNLTEDSFFEYNIKEDIMVCSKRFSKRFGIPEVIDNFSNIVRNTLLVAPESRSEISSKQLRSVSKKTVSTKVRLYTPSGKDYWYMLYYRVFGDKNGKPDTVVGKMNDITAEHNEINKLTRLSETDMLTGLYNKFSTEHFIKETLREDRRNTDEFHTFMIVDIDNFKAVNDNIGHLYGDALLAQLADKLKSIFRADDIVGRIGGDEFTVFLKNCKNKTVIAEKAQEICDSFKKTLTEGKDSIDISASIGIANSPQNGTDFEQLFGYADIALYHVKAQGKNGFAFYSDSMGRPKYVSQRTEFDSNLQGRKNYNRNKFEFYFNMLFEAENLPTIIASVIKLLAEQYSFDKGYIFELDTEQQLFCKTFSWDTPNSDGKTGFLTQFGLSDFTDSRKKLLEQGYLILDDIDTDAVDSERKYMRNIGAKTLLTFPILELSNFIGCLTFISIDKPRFLTHTEIAEMRSVVNIIVTFLLKYRLEKLLTKRDKDIV